MRCVLVVDRCVLVVEVRLVELLFADECVDEDTDDRVEDLTLLLRALLDVEAALVVREASDWARLECEGTTIRLSKFGPL